jgi:hypothetical protein
MTISARAYVVGLALTARILGAQAVPTGSLTGTVRDEVGRPVADALVVLDAESAPMRRERLAMERSGSIAFRQAGMKCRSCVSDTGRIARGFR